MFGSNNVREYDATTGALLNSSFVTGLNGPYGLALVAVPEPATWVGFTAGSLFVLGLILRRRDGISA